MIGFLNFAHRNHGLAAVPKFERDRKARNPNRRARRRIEELRGELISAVLDAAHVSLQAQTLYNMQPGRAYRRCFTGCGCVILTLARGASRLLRGTKNGEDVTAALNSSAIAILQDYLHWRGSLADREAPLFLTYRRKPYADNGRAYGGQNKTAFRAARGARSPQPKKPPRTTLCG